MEFEQWVMNRVCGRDISGLAQLFWWYEIVCHTQIVCNQILICESPFVISVQNRLHNHICQFKAWSYGDVCWHGLYYWSFHALNKILIPHRLHRCDQITSCIRYFKDKLNPLRINRFLCNAKSSQTYCIFTCDILVILYNGGIVYYNLWLVGRWRTGRIFYIY